MTPLLADESLSGNVIAAVRQITPGIDLVTASESGLLGVSDPDVRAWAAEHRRVVITSDEQTMIGSAYERVRNGMSMPADLCRSVPGYQTSGA